MEFSNNYFIKIKMDAGITIVNLGIKEYTAVNPLNIDKESNQGKITVEAAVRIEEAKHHIHVLLRVKMFIQQENMDLVSIGLLNTETSFYLTEWDKYVRKVNEKIIIQPKMDSFLIAVSYDSTRGLLRERGKNDLMGKVILPVVSPDEISRVNRSNESV